MVVRIPVRIICGKPVAVQAGSQPVLAQCGTKQIKRTIIVGLDLVQVCILCPEIDVGPCPEILPPLVMLCAETCDIIRIFYCAAELFRLLDRVVPDQGHIGRFVSLSASAYSSYQIDRSACRKRYILLCTRAIFICFLLFDVRPNYIGCQCSF